MRLFLFGLILMFSSAINAGNDSEITQWTQRTLLKALTIDSKYNSENIDPFSQGFTRNAWIALNGFLSDYLQEIRTKNLSTHPEFLIEPTVVDSGVASGIHYWRVNEEVLLPELHAKVAFSLIIIETNPSENGTYLIQSMNMEKQENP